MLRNASDNFARETFRALPRKTIHRTRLVEYVEPMSPSTRAAIQEARKMAKEARMMKAASVQTRATALKMLEDAKRIRAELKARHN